MRRTLLALLLAATLLAIFTLPAAASLPWKINTSGDDRMRGTDSTDRIDGRAGSDDLFGLESRDTLRGGFGRYHLRGGAGPDYLLGSGVAGKGVSMHDNGVKSSDTLSGGAGGDHMLGGLGADRLYGGAGPDEIHDHPAEFGTDRSVDVLSGGAGDDVLVSADVVAAEDRIVCGTGFDHAYPDAGDTVAADCERVTRSR